MMPVPHKKPDKDRRAVRSIRATPANDNDPRPRPTHPGAAVGLRDGALLFEFRDFPAELRETVTFTRFELPRFNTAIENGERSLDELINGTRHAFDVPALRVLAGVERRESALALKILKTVGFVVSSIERHGQHAGIAPGLTLASVAGLNDLLLALGQATGLPARDNIYTYWLKNPLHELSFTGSPEEAYFNFAVNETVRIQEQALDVLCQLRDIDGVRSAARDAEALDAVCNDLFYLRDVIYKGYFPAIKGIRLGGMRPDFFLRRMRTYLRSYPVGGEMLEPPNATYVATFPAMDFVLGVADEAYGERVNARFRWMCPEDRDMLARHMTSPGLLDVRLRGIGLYEKDLLSRSVAEVAQTIAAQGADHVAFFKALCGVLETWAKLASTHFGLVVNFVERPGKTMTPKERQLYRTEEGVSSAGLNHTRAILDMRRTHPVAAKLKTALSLI